ncbi:MAG TPA: Nramp family divalent metal transporter [Chitinophagales bacterium]|nr:Nramp family divalent metal transporter [Chitinophagales bacterium]
MASGRIHQSLEEVHESIDTTKVQSPWKRFSLFVGPAFLVAVGYMDPGNWATDIAGGSKYGYQLIWVLLMSNLIAILLQSLSARLGVVRGRDLAQASRETYPRAVNISLWVLAEIAIAACDLAEVIGFAIGLNLLFKLPLVWGVSLAVLDTLLILYLQRKGMRYLEAFILSLVALIGLSFFIELIFARPDLGEVATGFIPRLADSGALYIAIGIIGATVMPHNLYLHSSLVQTRRSKRDEAGIREAIKFNLWDSGIALNLAFFVNASILILAAAVFYTNGYNNIAEIQDAHRLLAPLLGKKLAPVLFAIALIASGQSSTITGTLAGQVVMEGYLDLRIAPWLRRLITRLLAVIPTLGVIYFFGDGKVGDLLILSQVILSLQLGFAIIPLIHFVSDKQGMGKYAISTVTKVLVWLSAVVILGLNIKLVLDTLGEWRQSLAQHLWVFDFVIIPVVLLAGLLFIYILWCAIFGKRFVREAKSPHGKAGEIPIIEKKLYRRVAICIDFSGSDIRAITEGVSHGERETEFYLLHVVETAGARSFGDEIHDYETLEDWKQLRLYGERLRAQGYHVHEQLGFGDPKKELPRLTDKVNAELLVIGKHGHRGIMDIIFGETINEVRHHAKCPVMVV